MVPSQFPDAVVSWSVFPCHAANIDNDVYQATLWGRCMYTTRVIRLQVSLATRAVGRRSTRTSSTTRFRRADAQPTISIRHKLGVKRMNEEEGLRRTLMEGTKYFAWEEMSKKPYDYKRRQAFWSTSRRNISPTPCIGCGLFGLLFRK